MTSKVLLRGIVDVDGHVKYRPVTVTLDGENRVLKHEFLDGYEPHSTTFDSTKLLDIKHQTLLPAK